MAIYQLSTIFGVYETSGVGLTSATANADYNNFTFNEGLWLLFAGNILFLLIGLYFEEVLPKEYGTRRHPCFMFLPSTYRGCCSSSDDDAFSPTAVEADERSSTLLRDQADNLELRGLEKENYEGVPPEIARLEMEGKVLRIEDL